MNVSAMGSAKKQQILADVGGASFFGRVVGGARACVSGVGVVFSDGKLLSLCLVPMLVHVGLFALFVWAGFAGVWDPLVERFAPDGEASAVGSVVLVIFRFVIGVAIVASALVVAVVVASVVCDPFYDLISERTEELFVGRNVGPPFSVGGVVRGIGRELVATALRLLVFGAVAVPLWLLSFTPATIVATPLSFVWTWLFFAYEYVSRSLVRHAVQPKDRFRPMFSHKAVFVGFGACAWLLSFLPLLSPLLVVSATRLYLSLAVHDRVPSLYTGDEKQKLKG